ncbi:MAG: thiol reductant ABC exporter subunit CydD, partial [Caldilineaceae bacterium]
MPVEKRIWRLNRHSRRLTLLAIGCGVFAALLLVTQLILLSETVDRAFLGGEDRAEVLPLLLFMLAILGVRSLAIGMADVVSQRAASHLKGDLRSRLTAHLLALGPAYTVAERSGELAYAAVSAVESLDDYVTQYLPARYLAALVPSLVFLTVLVIDPWTTLVLLFAGPMLLLLLALIGGRTKAIAERRFAELSWMSAFFLDILQGISTLKLFGRSREQIGNIQEISRQYSNTTMDLLRTAFQTSLVMEWAATAASAMVALEVSLRLMNGMLPFDRGFAVLLLTPEFFLPIRQMALKYHAGTAGKSAAERIFTVLDMPLPAQETLNDRQDPSPRAHVHSSLPVPSGDIRLHHVRVAFDEGRRKALDGVSFTLRQSQTVALVGPTGAGKSTVAQLLLRFIEPDEGSITVGGVPLAAVDPDLWRAHLAWVPQRPHLFFGSVADNLRLARPQANNAELVAAARAANAHDFIVALPQGYDSLIGEQGTLLSGGQRQRLAIARAFLKDAPILVLDEATANLDARNEALVSDALARLAQGRTVLIIAHRMQMVQQADEI